tara:strand:+ start:685 stop:1683 length:999 start_codon:yes stop_codon:yes gene_type:complete
MINMDNRLSSFRILICGLGSIGRRHLRVIKMNWPDVKISALRSGFGKAYDKESNLENIFFSLDDALTWNPTCVIIASPANYHLEHALSFARNDIPVLIEKPVGCGAEKLEDWDELLSISEKIPILVGYTYRHDPCALFVKERLIQHDFGRLVEADLYCGSWLPDWRKGIDYRDSVSAKKELGGGVLLELSHEIDLAMWFFGPLEIINSKMISTDILDIEVEDYVSLSCVNQVGVEISIKLNFCTTPLRRQIMIRGEKSSLVWDLADGTVDISNKSRNHNNKKLGLERDQVFKCELLHFFECAEKLDFPKCTLKDGINTLNLINKVKGLPEIF